MPSIFTTQTPQANIAGDPALVVGTGFTIDSVGYEVNAIRYWKWDSANDGLAIPVALYDDTETELGSGSRVQSGADPTGWTVVPLSSPVTITTGVTYAPGGFFNGNYPYTANELTSAVDNAPLHTVPTGGRFLQPASGIADPTSTSNNNYYIDVVIDLISVQFSAKPIRFGMRGPAPILDIVNLIRGTGPIRYAVTMPRAQTAGIVRDLIARAGPAVIAPYLPGPAFPAITYGGNLE